MIRPGLQVLLCVVVTSTDTEHDAELQFLDQAVQVLLGIRFVESLEQDIDVHLPRRYQQTVAVARWYDGVAMCKAYA